MLDRRSWRLPWHGWRRCFPETPRCLRRLSAPPSMSAHGKHRQQMLMLLHKAMLDSHRVHVIYETQ